MVQGAKRKKKSLAREINLSNKLYRFHRHELFISSFEENKTFGVNTV